MTPRAPLTAASQGARTHGLRKVVEAERWLDDENTEADIPWPPARMARERLADLVLGRSVTLWVGRKGRTRGLRQAPQNLPRDRYGRVLAHVTTAAQSGEESVWVQAALLRSGAARFYSAVDARACVRQLRHHEAAARRKRLGIWRHASYAVRRASRPDELLSYAHTFQVVEGRVSRVARYRRHTYINFGRYWKTDFTLVVEGGAHRLFGKTDALLKRLEGHRIRVRGWIERKDGPMMQLTHPEQIEVTGKGDSGVESGRLAAFDRKRQSFESGFSGDPVEENRDPVMWFEDNDDPGLNRSLAEEPKRPGRKKRQRRIKPSAAKTRPAPDAGEANQAPESELLSL
ncbi:MAG: thermonuclease family protein [Hyphomicrobiaceae bacterium]